MYRHLDRIPFWSIANSICRLKVNNQGRREAIHNSWFSRAFATSNVPGAGYDFLVQGLKCTGSLQQQIIDSLNLEKREIASNLLDDLGNGNVSLGANDFSDILKHCARSPDPLSDLPNLFSCFVPLLQFAMETWRAMEKNNVSPNHICYLHMVKALCRGGYLEEASNLVTYAGECHDVYPLLPLYNAVLRGCSKMRNMVHANLCLDHMESRMVGKNEVTYMELLKLAVWQQNIHAVHEIWKNYIRYYTPSLVALQKFIWSFATLREIQPAFKTLQYMVTLAFGGRYAVASTSEESNIMNVRKGSLGSPRLDIPVPYKFDLVSQDIDCKQTEQLIPMNSHTCSGIDNRRGTLSGVSVYQDMEMLKLSFDELLRACAKTKNGGLAKQLMLQMQKIGIHPSTRTYDGFVRALVRGEGLTEGMSVFKLMQGTDLKPHDSTLAALSVGCSKNLELDLAEAFLNELSDCRYSYPCNEFLKACDRLDQPERAVRVLAKMKKLNFKPDIWTYELLFSLFGNVNAPYEEGNMWSHMEVTKRIDAIEMDMAKNGVQHTHTSMKNLLKALGTEGMTHELVQHLRFAEDLFSRNNTYLGSPIYNIVLHALVEAQENRLALKIFKKMRSSHVFPNAGTYNIMIDCASSIQSYKFALSLLCVMMRVGFDPVASTYTSLMKIQMDSGDFDEALFLLDRMELEGISVDVLLYNTILDKAFAKGRIDITEFVVEHMRQHGVQPDPSTCASVFSAYVRGRFENLALEALQVLSMRMLSQEDADLEQFKAKFEDDMILSEDSEVESEILQLFVTPDERITVALLNLRWCAILGSTISWSPNRTSWARRLEANYHTKRRTLL
ncbi:Pentatricopeptide repeat-containing protein At1g76280 [Linum perenne]